MPLLDDLRKQRRLFARCPNCDESFRLSEARLFDATKPLPGDALAHLEDLRTGLTEEREELRRQQAAWAQERRDFEQMYERLKARWAAEDERRERRRRLLRRFVPFARA